MAYCGCGTKAAKIRWAAVIFLGLLGLALLVGSWVEVSKCELCDSNGVCDDRGFSYENNNGQETVTDSEGTVVVGATLEGCSLAAYITLQLIGILCLIGATVPCCINCCCAKPPYEKDMMAVAYAPYTHGTPPPGAPMYGTPGQPGFDQQYAASTVSSGMPQYDYTAPAPPPGVPGDMKYSSQPSY